MVRENRQIMTAFTKLLSELIHEQIAAAGGWIGFERFMVLALYTPGLGYYLGGLPKFCHLPESRSDFSPRKCRLESGTL